MLEVGAGVGELTHFWKMRGCNVVSTDGRPENGLPVLDIEGPPNAPGYFEIVFAYGLLYHLRNPARAISNMARCCSEMLLLETCISLGESRFEVPEEDDPRNSVHLLGCRPNREWITNELRKHFAYVYEPTTKPDHEEFRDPADGNARAVFIASRRPLVIP